MKPILAAILCTGLSLACTASDTGSGSGELSGQAGFGGSAGGESGGDGDGSSGSGESEGSVSASFHSGTLVALELHYEALATLPSLDLDCSLQGPGVAVSGIVEGEATIGDGGAFIGSFFEGAGELSVPAGCELPDLSTAIITEASIVARVEATVPRCEVFCAAHAASEAAAECGSDSACAASIQSQFTASCNLACTEEAVAIVAHTELGASALADLSAEDLSAGVSGALSADLSFDGLEDASGAAIDL